MTESTNDIYYNNLLKLSTSLAYKCTGEERVITFASGAVEKLTGFDASSLIGIELNSLVHGLNLRKVKETIDGTDDGGQYLCEYRISVKDGRHVWVRDTGTKLKDKDGILVTEGILTDISQSRRTKHTRERFLKNISREVRTPMSTVVGFLELAMDTLEREDIVQDYLSTARQASVSVLRMLNDLTDISRFETAERTKESIIFNLRELLESMTNYFAARAYETGTEIRLKFDENIPECYKGDRKRLRRIITLLLEGALSRSREGLITVHVSASDNGYVDISVEDCAEQMSKKMLKELFLPVSAGHDHQRTFKGTVIKLLAEQMNSAVRAHTSSVGNVITITASLNPENCAGGCRGTCFGADTYSSDGGGSSRGFNVLLAEDIQENADLAAFRLRRRGHRVDVTSDGAEAVMLFAKNNYDVVLLDLHMPLMDGVKAAKTIRAMHKGRYVPIIGMTSSVLPKDRQSGLESGMDAMFTKPLDFNMVFNRMEQLVSPDAGFDAVAISCVGESGADLSPVAGYIDADSGVRIWGSELMFIAALIDFAGNHGNCCDELSELMKKDVADAYKYAHRLKNIIMGLACDSLMSKISDIESWLYARDAAVAEMLLDDLRIEMEVFVSTVGGLKK